MVKTYGREVISELDGLRLAKVTDEVLRELLQQYKAMV